MFSVLFHVGLLTLIFVSMNFSEEENLVKPGDRVKTIKAKVVDQQQLEASKKKKQLDAEKRKKEEAKRKAVEKKKKQAEAKKKKQAEVKKKEEQKTKKLAEEKRKKEAAKLKADEKKKQEAEAQKTKQEAEEKEKQRKLAEVKYKKEEEKRRAEEKKKAEAEERRRVEEEKKSQEEDLKARLEAEESQRKLDSQRDAYRLAIKERIERYWRRPQESGKMPDCEVRVLQGPGGIILDVTFGACSGGTNTYRASIENAVYKAEPLPKPGDPALFERELIIEFKPR